MGEMFSYTILNAIILRQELLLVFHCVCLFNSMEHEVRGVNVPVKT